MNSIDITTSQQVVITYELASVRDPHPGLLPGYHRVAWFYLGFFIFGVIGGMQDSNLFYWVAFLVMSFYSLFTGNCCSMVSRPEKDLSAFRSFM